MRILAVLALCSLPLAAAAQTTDYGRLTAFQRDLQALHDTVERLQFRLGDLEKRIAALESGQREPAPAGLSPPASAVGGALPSGAAPVAAVGVGWAEETPDAQPGGGALALYREGRRLLLQGRLPEAEDVFAAFLQRFPGHGISGNARHWLATSLAGQGKHGPAAQQFLLAYEGDPEGSKSPDNLLKLARSLAALDKKEEACLALGRLAREHRQAPRPVIAGADAERLRLQC